MPAANKMPWRLAFTTVRTPIKLALILAFTTSTRVHTRLVRGFSLPDRAKYGVKFENRIHWSRPHGLASC